MATRVRGGWEATMLRSLSFFRSLLLSLFLPLSLDTARAAARWIRVQAREQPLQSDGRLPIFPANPEKATAAE